MVISYTTNAHAIEAPVMDPKRPGFLPRPGFPDEPRWLFQRSTLAPVGEDLIEAARSVGLENARATALVCREVGVGFARACALVWIESGGRNVYGHDLNGMLSDFEHPVNVHNFRAFMWALRQSWLDVKSNGVGPCQITYYPYFEMMAQEGLRPWIPYDNILFGVRLLNTSRIRYGSWRQAAAHYNGGTNPGDRAYEYADKFEEATLLFRRKFREVTPQ